MVYENLLEIPLLTVIPPGQSVTTTTPPPLVVNPNAVPIVAPNGLVWNENPNLSNGLASRLIAGAAGINDFTIVNPYIHYESPPGNVITFDPRSLLQLATQRFNIYSSQYRT